MLRLLLKDVLYDHQHGKIKLTLRQLPDLDLQVEDDKVSFDERQIWLPEPDADQDLVYDEFRFEEVRLTKWRRCLTLLPEEDAVAECLTLDDVSETLPPVQS